MTRAHWVVEGGVADITRARADARRLRFDARPEHLVVDLNRCAVVVIDMQNDFVSPGGWLDHIGVDVRPLDAAVGPIRRLLPALRRADVPVIFVDWGNRPDRANLPPEVLHVYDPDGTGTGIGEPLPNGSRVLEKGSWSAAIVDTIEVAPTDILVDKYRMTGFADTELDSILRTLDVSTLLFCGVNLDQCVLATLTDAASLGYDCVLLEDCTATTSPEACVAATLYNVAQCFGFVASSEAVLASLEDRRDAEWHEIGETAHRISPGDSVKLSVLRRPDANSATSVFLEIWDPGGSQPPNSHPRSAETFFVLCGRAIAECDGVRTEIEGPGLLVLPAGSVHRIENVGDDRLYAITTMANDDGFCALVERGPVEPLDGADLGVIASLPQIARATQHVGGA